MEIKKYKLLIYNSDFGDEFNVPSLNVMTEEEYNKWLETPTGIFNENYEQDIEEYIASAFKYEKFVKELKDRDLWTKPVKDYTEEEALWIENNRVHYPSHNPPTRIESSYIIAYLGNISDYFEESFLNYEYFKDLVKDSTVKVFDIDEAFYNNFKKFELDRISLCNVCFIPEEYLYQNECN